MIKQLVIAFAAASMLFAPAAFADTPPGVLIIGLSAEPKSLDPAAAADVNDFRVMMNIYEGLVRYKDGTQQIEPALAESWHISNDGKTYTFRLREGVRFHDGAPFNAAAVKFSFDRMLDGEYPHHNTGYFSRAFFLSVINQVEEAGEYEVVFQLNIPYSPFLAQMASPAGLVVSPRSVRVHDKNFGRKPSGTGAFRFEIWRRNSKIALSRNDDYRGDAPPLNAVIFRPITNAESRTAKMLAGSLDMITDAPPESIGQFQASSDFDVHQQTAAHVWFLILNTAKGVFADKRIRQAANYAINKRAISENVLYGAAEVATGPVSPAFSLAYNDSLDPYPYDPRYARELLKAAGYDGKELIFYIGDGGYGMFDTAAMGAAIQNDLQAVGMPVRIETLGGDAFLAAVREGLEGKADMAAMARITNDPDTLPFLALHSESFPNKGGFNAGYYYNAEVDDLLEAARQNTDKTERAKLYKTMQEIIREDAPWVFVANWKPGIITKAQVKNFHPHPSQILMLHRISKP